MHAQPHPRPRAVDRRRNAAPASFPLLLPEGLRIERDRRRGDRRRLGFISQVDLFRGVPYSVLEEVLAGCPVREFDADQVLLEPGQANTNVFLVLHGRLRVHLDAIDSGNAILIEAGGCIGEMSIIDGKPVSAFVVAERGSRILIVREEHFWSKILLDVRVVRNLLQMLTERVRRNNETMLKGLKERLVLEFMQKELGLANEIQNDMLRTAFALPGLADRVDLYACMQAAREVGGDLYDFFVLPQGGLCIVVGDVSGKGIPAALFMARTLEIVRLAARLLAEAGGTDPEPAAILSQVNRALCENNPSLMFVTMFLGVLDPRTGGLRYCNAGHDAPYVQSCEGKVSALDGLRNAPLGIRPSFAYRGGESRLRDGEMLFVFTDGVTEAMNGAGDLFEHHRLQQCLQAAAGSGSEQIVSAVTSSVRTFAGATPQSDDITAIAVRLLRGAADAERCGSSSPHAEIVIKNQLEDLPRAVRLLDEFAGVHSISGEILADLQVALDEVLANIIHYAYADQGVHEIRIEFRVVEDVFEAQIEDDGSPFDPLSVGVPDISAPVGKRPIGGLGIHLVRKLMSEVIYARAGDCNRLVLRKNLSDREERRHGSA